MHEVKFWPGNPLSYTTTRLELYRDETFLSFASGFILKFGGGYGLVTNYHVLGGVNPATGKVLSSTGAIPSRVKFHAAVQTRWLVEDVRHEEIFFKPMSINLDDDDGAPVWFDDRGSHPHNDYAILRLEPYFPELAEAGVTIRAILGGRVALKRDVEKPATASSKLSADSVQHFYPPVGERVFVLGYPQGVASTGVFPIWKGATIASEPFATITLDDNEYENVFYIDATTKAGMSGSPVVVLGRDDLRYYTEDGILIEGKREFDFLIGVYSGRDGVTQAEYEIALGRVWKVSAVEALFALTMGRVPPIRPVAVPKSRGD